MLTIKEVKNKEKYNVSENQIVLEGKDGDEVYGYVVCEIDGSVFVISKLECDEPLLADGLKRAALNYALNRNIIEADFLGEEIDIIAFFNMGCSNK